MTGDAPPLVLVVEDNERNRRLVEMVLRREFRLAFAADGEQALERAAECRPDLILLDIQIPKLDGFEVARRLRASPEWNRTPIVALTSHAMAGDRERVLEAGCDGYLTKPVETRTLAAELHGFIARRTEA